VRFWCERLRLWTRCLERKDAGDKSRCLGFSPGR
jgi:hypothetical protein